MSFRIKSLVVAVIPVITLSCTDSTSPVNALPATLEISLSATGDEVSPDGFTFDILLAGSSAPIPGTVHQNGSTKFSGLPPGEYVIVMKALPLERLGCVGVSPLAQSVSLVAGGVASVAFRIACVRVPELAVVLEHAPYGTELGIVKAAQRIQITAYEGLVAEPAWSPDGTRIAFVRQADTAAIFINNADTDEIDVMDADGGDLLRLTNGTHPAWSPDGKRIAFRGEIPPRQFSS